jgi:hypothetical protein
MDGDKPIKANAAAHTIGFIMVFLNVVALENAKTTLQPTYNSNCMTTVRISDRHVRKVLTTSPTGR